MNCFQCHSPMLAGHVEHTFTIAGVTVRGHLPADVCSECGESTIESNALHALDLMVARTLTKYGIRTGEVFRFMRKTLGMRAVDLAKLLGVNEATISRWENGHHEVELLAFALLADMADDEIEGRTSTLERLKRLARPPAKLPSILDVPTAPEVQA